MELLVRQRDRQVQPLAVVVEGEEGEQARVEAILRLRVELLQALEHEILRFQQTVVQVFLVQLGQLRFGACLRDLQVDEGGQRCLVKPSAALLLIVLKEVLRTASEGPL